MYNNVQETSFCMKSIIFYFPKQSDQIQSYDLEMLDLKFYPISHEIHDKNSSQTDDNQSNANHIKLSQFQGNCEEVDLQSLYEYSQRNVLMAQEMIIQPNFTPPMQQNHSLKESREIEAQSSRVPRPFFINPSAQELQQTLLMSYWQENEQKLTGQRLHQQEKHNMNKSKQPTFSKCQYPYEHVQKRISIFLEGDKQSYQSNLKDGLIPLRSNIKAQSLVINTYRILKNRFQNIQLQREKQQTSKKKTEQTKKEQNRFKGTTITYDYNGQPIPLKNYKRPQSNNFISKNAQSITIIPLAENIVLPSSTNKKRLEKRKARYIEQQEEKQNNSRNSNVEPYNFSCWEGSDFIKKTPTDIKKSKLFNGQVQPSNYRKFPDKVTFSQFKKSLDKARNFNNFPSEPKSKIKLSNLSDVKEEKCKKKVNKINFSQGKVFLNQKVFQSVFNFKPNLNEIESDKQQELVSIKQSDQIRFNNQISSKKILQKNPRLRESKLFTSVSSTLKNLMKRQQLEDKNSMDFKNIKNPSIFRRSLHSYSKKSLHRPTKSMHEQKLKVNRDESIDNKNLKNMRIFGRSGNILKASNGVQNQNKRKLKTKPSCKNLNYL